MKRGRREQSRPDMDTHTQTVRTHTHTPQMVAPQLDGSESGKIGCMWCLDMSSWCRHTDRMHHGMS